MALLAAVENIFPPIPADVLVAFGGLLAARGGNSPWPAFLCVWLGNVTGAIGMYFMGRRLGSKWIERRFRLAKKGDAQARIVEWHQKYGAAALFASRFVPGLRAVVPPVAGALRIPVLGVALSIAAASGIWYGLITWLAFNTGANWEQLSATVKRYGTWTALGAGVILAIVVGILWRRRHRR